MESDGYQILRLFPDTPLSVHDTRTIGTLRRLVKQGASSPTSSEILSLAGETGFFVARDLRGKIIGMARVSRRPDFGGSEGWIDEVAVLPKYKKQGIGRALLLEIKKHALTFNATALALTSHSGREAARRLYERFGFKNRGETTRYRMEL